MRRYSFPARQAHRGEFSDEEFAVLFIIEHPDMDKTIRLSSHPTHDLSFDPPMWATYSTWRTANPTVDPFVYLPMETNLPSDQEDAPASGNIIVVNSTPQIAKLLRSVIDQATLHFAMVRAASPDLIEMQMSDLLVIDHDITAGEVTIEFSREPTEFEMDPEGVMTKERFPGMHR
ncbi:hypothetical protein [Shinella sp. M31]|uniref:hypothetical protein n=1 Tax=Shinella sp. M31 TaxID=3368615 RepID=UPI003BA0FB5A